VQTEDVRKFTGSTGLAICPSVTAVTDCVELDCIGLGANFIDRIERIVTEHEVALPFSIRRNLDTLPCFVCYCNLQHTAVQHIQHLNTQRCTVSALGYCSC